MKRFWIINLVLFQATWVSSAFFTEQAVFIAPLLVALHFFLSPTRRDDFRVLLLLPIGLLLDSLMIGLGTFSAHPNIANQTWFPVWLACLWVMFIISFNHSLNWIMKCPKVILFLLGFVGGTSSYWGGIKAGALQSTWPDVWVLSTLAVSWGLVIPLLVVGYSYLNKPNMAETTR
jgi:hypothetical protein